ncbi:hypothetical protein A2U01_0098633, partial [Trifolium medium]|nr:hypothetical protein [Trifolium medium]
PLRAAQLPEENRNNSHTAARNAGHSCAPRSQQNKTNNTSHSLHAAQHRPHATQ